MRPRGWVTLIIRVIGLASVLWGVYDLITTIEAASNIQSLPDFGGLAKDTPLAEMFKAENFRPSYVGPALWIGAGLALMALGGPLGRFLFSGIETPEPNAASR